MTDNMESTSKVYYEASINIIEASQLILPHNHILGKTILSVAKSLIDEVGNLKSFELDDVIDETANSTETTGYMC